MKRDESELSSSSRVLVYTCDALAQDMKSCWPEQQWNALHLRLIYFGREFCSAQRHDPTQCSICSWAAVAPYNV